MKLRKRVRTRASYCFVLATELVPACWRLNFPKVCRLEVHSW
jgi:hypothetical protein